MNKNKTTLNNNTYYNRLEAEKDLKDLLNYLCLKYKCTEEELLNELTQYEETLLDLFYTRLEDITRKRLQQHHTTPNPYITPKFA